MSNKDFNLSEPFKNLFTQGMVCHESYKDNQGNWLYPDEVEKIDKNKFIKKSDKSKVNVGPPESMSKSKKNTIDPEIMINQYGADAVRWFILSDSPPDKDIQWSATGVEAANKFLQKIWNLNYLASNRDDKNSNQEKEKKLISDINNLIFKIDESISSFKYNVSISYFYQVYKLLRDCIDSEISNKILKDNIIKIMTLMTPFTPHLSHECLELMKSRNYNKWPEIDKKYIMKEIKLAVQINGKTRDIIIINKDLSEKEVNLFILKNSKAKKYVDSKKIIKTIFVQNKIINYIVNDK